MKNPAGTAPGFIITGKPSIAAFPGVPTELNAMFPQLLEFINENYSIEIKACNIFVKTIGIPESLLDQSVKSLAGKGINFGTIANFGQVDLRLDIPGQ